MLELVGGGTSLAKGRFSEKPLGERSLGLDFANLLEHAQFEQESTQVEKRTSRTPAPTQRTPEREEASQLDEDSLEEGEETMGKNKVPKEENAESSSGVAHVGNEHREQQEVEEGEDIEAFGTSTEKASWGDMDAGKIDESNEEVSMDTSDFEAVDMEMTAVPTQGNGGVASNPLELLNVAEMMDPDLSIEKGVEQIATRITQAASGQAAVMEEMTETILPQVIRSVATLVRAGGAEMRLQLQPADLGEIELRVRTAEAAVRGELVVSNPEVKQLLEQNMGRLREALAQQGLDLEGFSVDVGGQSTFAESREEFGQQRPSGTHDQTGEAVEVASMPSTVRMPDSGDVDFTA